MDTGCVRRVYLNRIAPLYAHLHSPNCRVCCSYASTVLPAARRSSALAVGLYIASLTSAFWTNQYPAKLVGSSLKNGARRRVSTYNGVRPVPCLLPIVETWKYPSLTPNSMICLTSASGASENAIEKTRRSLASDTSFRWNAAPSAVIRLESLTKFFWYSGSCATSRRSCPTRSATTTWNWAGRCRSGGNGTRTES